MFRKLINLGLACGLFGLVWAAGHDILKGQPNAWMEWTVVLAGSALSIRLLWQERRKFYKAVWKNLP